MTLEIAARYLHFISIFAIVAALSIEAFSVRPAMTRAEIGRISRIDGIYGLAALTLLAAGFTLWFWVGKPADYYSKNFLFHTKLALFTAAGILSAWPTVFFLKKRKGNPDDIVIVPVHIRRMITIQLILIACIPLLAGLMAKGIGYFGS
ncbi:membrane protein [Thermaurantimonas aggregans]|uniref:Membrane protein n=1 Tax=Thermaurantimonas aggregans TaxID=2173829 RepID=A0A401XK29_9FLAO|nr:DUF2214 family protein [Thermaurantimonas aggregans]MCX8148529.1 DUF2214 family protein [Thermaurantimonas aggregans]GCD77395.1 membrane protein [Thermaurantimonas aggregans]